MFPGSLRLILLAGRALRNVSGDGWMDAGRSPSCCAVVGISLRFTRARPSELMFLARSLIWVTEPTADRFRTEHIMQSNAIFRTRGVCFCLVWLFCVLSGIKINV